MGLKQRIVASSKQALLRPSVLRWVTDDRVMKATEGFMDARTRVRDAWQVLLKGTELPNIDPALDENIGRSAPNAKTNGHASNGHASNGHANGNGHTTSSPITGGTTNGSTRLEFGDRQGAS